MMELGPISVSNIKLKLASCVDHQVALLYFASYNELCDLLDN